MWNSNALKTGARPWVFCASLADVFDNEVDPGWRYQLWTLVASTPALRWQFVTKRIGNAMKMLPHDWEKSFSHCGIVATTVTQEECDRDLPKLIEVKRAFGVRWVGLSIEPQLEMVIPSSPGSDSLDWVITGGESAQGGQPARPYSPHWARRLIDESEVFGYKVFVKQMGSNSGFKLKDRAGADPSEWPEDLRVRDMPDV